MSILDKLDELSIEEQLKSINKRSKAEIERDREERKEALFKDRYNKSLNNEAIKDNFLGQYRNHELTTQGRIDNMILMLNKLQELSRKGIIKENDDLYVNPSDKNKYKNELIKTVKGLYKELGDVNLKTTIEDKYRSNEAQSYLNERSLGQKGKILAEGTCNNIKARIEKINLVETIGMGHFNDYSSTIRTTYEINNEIEGYRKDPNDKNVNKQFNYNDYNRAKEGIVKKLRDKPEKVTDAEVMFILSGDFLMRKSTIEKLTVEQFDISNNRIEVFEEQNKSKQDYAATSGYLDREGIENKEIISLVVQRSKLRNFNKRNEDGFIPIITSSENNLYKGYKRILKTYDIKETWQGKYHSLRHMGAQRLYDEVRSTIEEENANIAGDKTKAEMIMEALREVNYKLGHTADHIDNTMQYIRNPW